MEANSIILILFAVLFITMVIIASYLMHNSTLEKLPLLPGEKILLEEKGIRVEEMLRGEGIKTIYTHCRVRLTNKRIITAQMPWFVKKRTYLRHVINYVEKGPELATQGAGMFLESSTLMKGYLTIYTSKDRIGVETIHNKQVVKITTPLANPGFLREPCIFIYTNNTSAFAHL